MVRYLELSYILLQKKVERIRQRNGHERPEIAAVVGILIREKMIENRGLTEEQPQDTRIYSLQAQMQHTVLTP